MTDTDWIDEESQEEREDLVRAKAKRKAFRISFKRELENEWQKKPPYERLLIAPGLTFGLILCIGVLAHDIHHCATEGCSEDRHSGAPPTTLVAKNALLTSSGSPTSAVPARGTNHSGATSSGSIMPAANAAAQARTGGHGTGHSVKKWDESPVVSAPVLFSMALSFFWGAMGLPIRKNGGIWTESLTGAKHEGPMPDIFLHIDYIMARLAGCSKPAATFVAGLNHSVSTQKLPAPCAPEAT